MSLVQSQAHWSWMVDSEWIAVSWVGLTLFIYPPMPSGAWPHTGSRPPSQPSRQQIQINHHQPSWKCRRAGWYMSDALSLTGPAIPVAGNGRRGPRRWDGRETSGAASSSRASTRWRRRRRGSGIRGAGAAGGGGGGSRQRRGRPSAPAAPSLCFVGYSGWVRVRRLLLGWVQPTWDRESL